MGKYEYRYQGILLEDAVRIIKENLLYRKEENVETVALINALGRVAAQDYIAAISQPPFARSPLDGYAVCSEDIKGATCEQPVQLQVIEEILAGNSPQKAVESGQAARIMTGAPIPQGADCIVRQEDTDYGEVSVSIYKEVGSYQNYCFAGEDFKAGECLVAQNTVLTSIELGLLASMGINKVQVYEKPRIGLFTTGDELVKPGETLQPGKIYNSNLYVLWGRLKELGMEPIIADCLPDTEEGVAEKLKEILPQVDVIITTGGVSVGKKDIMHGVLQLMEADKIFWKVRLKPGTPTIFAMVQGIPVIALSGNPFGAITNLELLVRPLLAEMTGNEKLIPKRKNACIQSTFGKTGETRRFLRAKYEDGKVYLPSGLHSSGVLASMRECNCLVEIPAGKKGIQKQEQVEIVML